MTDSGTGKKSDDVLTSVRRLVSDAPRTPSPAGKPDCLILTPAQRVPAEEPPAAAERMTGDDAPATRSSGPIRANGQGAAPPLTAAMALSRLVEAEITRAIVPETGTAVPPAPGPDDSATEFSRTVATLEDMVGRRTEDWDGDEADTQAAFIRHTDSAPLPGQQGGGLPVGPDQDAALPALFDEAQLRGMVAEIVRQELQGALGERITRNVRKLVRREIHRVLMSQEFD